MANDKKKKDIILDKEKVFKHYIDLNGDHTVLFAHGDFRVITHAKTKNGAYRACRRKILDYINSLIHNNKFHLNNCRTIDYLFFLILLENFLRNLK